MTDKCLFIVLKCTSYNEMHTEQHRHLPVVVMKQINACVAQCASSQAYDNICIELIGSRYSSFIWKVLFIQHGLAMAELRSCAFKAVLMVVLWQSHYL